MVLDINVNVNNSKGKSKAGKNPKKAKNQENKPRVKHYMLQNFLRGNCIQNRWLLRRNPPEPQTLGDQWRNFRDDIEIDLRERFGMSPIPGRHQGFWS